MNTLADAESSKTDIAVGADAFEYLAVWRCGCMRGWSKRWDADMIMNWLHDGCIVSTMKPLELFPSRRCPAHSGKLSTERHKEHEPS